MLRNNRKTVRDIGCKFALLTNMKSRTGTLGRKNQWSWMTLNRLMTADARYLCSSWASC